MILRGKTLWGGGWFSPVLILAIILMSGVGILAAEGALPQMVKYMSNLNYELNYPGSWLRIDRSNTGAVRAEHDPAGADSNAVHSSHLNFVLAQIDSLEIKAAFIENPSSDDSAAILVSFGPMFDKIDKGIQNSLGDRFENSLIPPGAVVKKLDFDISRKGFKRYLFLAAQTSEPGYTEGRHYHSVAVNGKERSFILTLLGSEADVQRLMPVLDSMAASLKDRHGKLAGNNSLTPGIYILLLVLISLIITWLIIRLRKQALISSRGRHRKKELGFFPLFLMIFIIVVIPAYLIAPGQFGYF